MVWCSLVRINVLGGIRCRMAGVRADMLRKIARGGDVE